MNSSSTAAVTQLCELLQQPQEWLRMLAPDLRKSPFWQSNKSEVSLCSKATLLILFAVVVAFVTTAMVGARIFSEAWTVAMMAAAVATALLLMVQAYVFIRAQMAQKGPPGGVSRGTPFNTTTTAAAATTAAPEGTLNTSRFDNGLSAHKRLHQRVSSHRIGRKRCRSAALKRRVDFDQHGYVSNYSRLRANNFAVLLAATITTSLLDSAHADTMMRTPAGDEWHKAHDPWAIDPSSPDISSAARQALKLVHQKKLKSEEVQWVVTSAEKRALHVRHDKGLRSVKYRLTIHQQVGGKYCRRCPNPQLIGGECSVMSVDLVHYVKKGTWLLPNKSISSVTCHEDFLTH